MDAEDFFQLPWHFYFKFDRDGYPLLYFYSEETRREENVRLARWIRHNPKGLLVDHIDRNKLNHLRNNLRDVTHSQNSQNVAKKSGRLGRTNTSKYVGVCLDKNTGKWQATIRPYKSKSIYLGQFSSEAEAAFAYNTAVDKYRDGFGFKNKIDE